MTFSSRALDRLSHLLGRLAGIRRDQPSVPRVLIVEHLLCSELLPSAIVYIGLKVAGYDLAGPCGLRGARIETANLHIGAGSWANRRLWIEGRGSVFIGRGVLIGPEVLITTSTHERQSNDRVRLVATSLPVRVGDHCWIGARAQILAGVTIGDGVTVAAGAVVASDIGPGGVYGGVPARKIK
jgi:acetyltransferase-like isoleucine patch superfamily enzyme